MHEDRNGQDRRNRIPVIGLTGGIGTGKSTVACGCGSDRT